MDFNNTGAMRSPFSPRVRQSMPGRRPIGMGSAKKNQSKYNQPVEDVSGDVIYKTPLITLETYGAPLPVMVTEALTFASGDVSVRLSPCGWCWVVAGRRVLAWPRTAPSDTPASSGPSAARELTLPQTDLAHKADLVMLFYEDGAQMPSCIGVSPEGIVRYWASVGQEGAYIDVSCELAGQECDRIACTRSRAPLVLATTTCTLVLLTPSTVDGRATVTCKTLRPPSGWLGGIGRRVSLMFFGSMPAHVETKLVGVVVVGCGGFGAGGGCVALVAGGAPGPVLQAWRGDELAEHGLRRPLLDAIPRAVAMHHGELSTVELTALEVRALGDSGLLLLFAVASVARAPDTRYYIAQISLEELSQPVVSRMVGLRGGAGAGEDAPRFLPLPTHVLLYTHHYIALFPSGAGGDKAEYCSVGAEGDRLLGGELCPAPLLFSLRHGLLRLRPHSQPHRSVCESPMGSPCPSDMYDGNLSLYEIDPHEISSVTTDACGKLKTAFLFHLRRESAPCRDLLQQLFPAPPVPPAPTAPAERDVDDVLDRTVLRITTEMLDDMPAGDPRWTGSAGGIALGRSAALAVGAQLADKKRAFTLFLEFLQAAGLWQRLQNITYEGSVVETRAALCWLAQQLAAAAALHARHKDQDAPLIDAAIHQVVCSPAGLAEEEPEVAAALDAGALAASDVCYRRVSRLHRVLRALAALHSPAVNERARLLALLQAILLEMGKTRLQWASAAPPTPPARALFAPLLDLVTSSVNAFAGSAECALRAQVLEGAAALGDTLLGDAASLAASEHAAHLYRAMRRQLILPFMAAGQLERASALAEKHGDLQLLVEMCVQAGHAERLLGYMQRYADEGICELAFAHLAELGGAHVRTLTCTLGSSARLRAWLGGADARRALHALHRLHAREPARAAVELAHLALNETQSVSRATTMASLAKLCLLASDEGAVDGGTWRQVEARLALCAQHAALPRDIRLHHGLDAPDTRLLAPEDLVQMYIDSRSEALTEYDYKKALDLTDHVHDMERRDELRLGVWCASVLRDDWTARGVAPRDELQDKMFFRLLDLVHVMGGDLELLLPPLEDVLTAPALAELVGDPRVHFLIKYGYEARDPHSLLDV